MTKSDRKITVCALLPYPPGISPSQRFRLEQWLPYLEAEGIQVDLVPFVGTSLMKFLHKPGRNAAKALSCSSAFFRRLLSIATVSRYDAVLVHRAACLVGPAVLERAIPYFRRPLIFDFDDAIYLLDTTEANRRFARLKFPGKTATLCRISSHVVVGNSYLGDFARQHNPNVTIIPSSVDIERYRPAMRNRPNNRIIVGWTGSSTSQAYLEMFAPVLREVVANRDIEIRVHSDREPTLPGIPFVWRPWSADTEVEELAQFDIGIMPIPDNPWSRGKCAMKALLYMAMGIPAICSAVGTNRQVILHGENGLLSATPAEWISNLELLIDNPMARERLGTAGRRTVEDCYSMCTSAAVFSRVVHQTVGRQGSWATSAKSEWSVDRP